MVPVRTGLEQNDRLIGDVTLHADEDDPAGGEIGYSLASASMGHGYASEAVTALPHYLFNMRAKEQIIAWADTRNEASLVLLQRLTFNSVAGETCESWFKGEWSKELKHVMTRRAWLELHGENDA